MSHSIFLDLLVAKSSQLWVLLQLTNKLVQIKRKDAECNQIVKLGDLKLPNYIDRHSDINNTQIVNQGEHCSCILYTKKYSRQAIPSYQQLVKIREFGKTYL